METFDEFEIVQTRENGFAAVMEDFVDSVDLKLATGVEAKFSKKNVFKVPCQLEILKFLDGIEDSLRKALDKKGRKVSIMESHIVDLDIQLYALRELIAPQSVKYFDLPVESVPPTK